MAIYNENNKVDLTSLMLQIEGDFTDMDIIGMYDDEVSSGNWVDDDWADEYDSEHDAYQETGRGEVEDAVIASILLKYELSYDDFDDGDYDDFKVLLGDYCDLNFTI